MDGPVGSAGHTPQRRDPPSGGLGQETGMSTVAVPPVGVPTAAAPAVVPAGGARARLDSVDLLRGLVMVIMALDHVRDYFTAHLFDPADLSRAGAALFFTRWITHFCAPVFVFLAGAGAFLSGAKGRPRRDLAVLLVTRGLWLILIELTVLRFGWFFNLDYHFVGLQVIWVIGISMIVLAALVWLPPRAVAAMGIAMIVTHNAFDGIHAGVAAGGPLVSFPGAGAAPIIAPGRDWLISFLHEQHAPFVYPLIPWVGVMAAGYGFGPLLLRPDGQRRQVLIRLGLALTAAFLVLRAMNVYGDPKPWSPQGSALLTLLSFLNTTKYPPSLLFLLMTLGPAIALLPLLERARGPVARFFIVYGRVPFLYYVAHIYLVHALSLAAGVAAGIPASELRTVWRFYPKRFGFDLPIVYIVWGAIVFALYPVCRWFAELKARRRDWWLSYL
jgi:uncharacterized membrane protein